MRWRGIGALPPSHSQRHACDNSKFSSCSEDQSKGQKGIETVLLKSCKTSYHMHAGNGSDNNAAFASSTPNNANTGQKISGSNDPGSSSAEQRQSSALSMADLSPAACLAKGNVLCSDSKFFPEASFVSLDKSLQLDMLYFFLHTQAFSCRSLFRSETLAQCL